jgi:hypothetical protein
MYVDVVVAFAFAMWAAASVIYSSLHLCKRMADWIDDTLANMKKYDAFKLVPHWGFFASPGPLSDTKIFVRIFTYDCSMSDWHDVTPSRRQGNVQFFTPTRRRCRTVLKNAKRLGNLLDETPLRVSEKDSPRDFIALQSYQMVLAYVRELAFHPSVERFQFLVTKREAPFGSDRSANVSNQTPAEERSVSCAGLPLNCQVLMVSMFHQHEPRSEEVTDRATIDREGTIQNDGIESDVVESPMCGQTKVLGETSEVIGDKTNQMQVR